MSTISANFSEKYSEDFSFTLGAPRQIFESVRQVLFKQHYQYPLRPLFILGCFGVQSPAEIELKKRTEQVIKTNDQALFISKGNLDIPGIALVAAYLQQKNNVQNLYVCESTKAFKEKLGEIIKTDGNLRAALIVPVNFGEEQTYKMGIGIEKQGPALKIVILNPDPSAWKTIKSKIALTTPNQFENLSAEDEKEGYPRDRYFDDTRYVKALLSTLYQAPLNMDNIQIYTASSSQLEGKKGNGSIALRDGIAFLKDRSFFESLKTENTSVGDKVIKTIQKLPEAMIKATCPIILRKYLQENPSLLNKIVKKYVHVSLFKNTNDYSAIKSFKDSLFVLKVLETQNIKQIQEIISKSLVRHKK